MTRIALLEADGAATIRAAVAQCVDEVRSVASGSASSDPTVIAGIGTTAAHALKGRLLHDALLAENVDLADTVHFDSPVELLGDSRWSLALVLSPWKQELAPRIPTLTPSAAQTGVVDTIVRGSEGTVGVNTNSWASQAAMETLMGGRTPESVLVLGSGGSSNSVALACRRAWPQARLIGSARNVEALAIWARRFDAEYCGPAALAELLGDESPSLLVNTTTWGETDASEDAPFAFDFGRLASPGNEFFDLNNRVSALQTSALQAGMNVMSGTFMQRATNACRAALSKARMR
jgi:shikimate dehydrogenase